MHTPEPGCPRCGTRLRPSGYCSWGACPGPDAVSRAEALQEIQDMREEHAIEAAYAHRQSAIAEIADLVEYLKRYGVRTIILPVEHVERMLEALE